MRKYLLFILLCAIFSACESSEFQNKAPAVGSQGPKGPKGPSPAQGPAGPIGAAGPTGADCFGSTCDGDTEFSGVLTMSGQNIFAADPSGTGVTNAPFLVNPASPAATETLFGIADNGTGLFKVIGNGNTSVTCTPQGAGLSQGCVYINSTAPSPGNLLLIQDQASSLNYWDSTGTFNNENAEIDVQNTVTVLNGSAYDATSGGFAVFHDPSASNLVMDTEGIQARGAGAELNINNLGGNVMLGDASSDYIFPGTLTLSKYQNAFHVQADSGQNITTTTATKVMFNTLPILINEGSHFDQTTSTYTVPSTGYYALYVQIGLYSYTIDEVVFVKIFVNNSEAATVVGNITHENGTTRIISGMIALNLTAGQAVDVRVQSIADASYNISYLSYFGGVRIY